MKTRKVIYADEGMVLTNGKIYGKQIFLGEGDSECLYYEITEEQYQQHLEEEMRKSEDYSA